jgi:hypothetical protein
MKTPTYGALRCAFLECRRLYGTLRQVYCFLEISLNDDPDTQSSGLRIAFAHPTIAFPLRNILNSRPFMRFAQRRIRFPPRRIAFALRNVLNSGAFMRFARSTI